MPIISRHNPAGGCQEGKPRRRPRSLAVFAAAWLVAGMALPAVSAQPADSTSQKANASVEHDRIEYLIASVAALKRASFIRNGQAYDASRAADHMRLKWRFAGSRVKTAEDFIRDCATASSTSGTPYTIRFADGRTMASATFLRDKLAQYGTSATPAGGRASP